MSNELASIESEIEQTREALASTLDQLLHRASPKTIVSREVESVKAKFVDTETGEPNTNNILITAGIVVGVATLFVVLRKLAK